MMDAHLGRTCKKLALEDYVHLLSLVAESLADPKHVPPSRLSHIVRLAALLLHEHPSRQFSRFNNKCRNAFLTFMIDSLVHVQKFATSCINIFTEYPVFVGGPVVLRLQVLDTIVQHCSDQVRIHCNTSTYKPLTKTTPASGLALTRYGRYLSLTLQIPRTVF